METSETLENALSTLPLKSMSDEELNKVRAILSSKVSEVDYIFKCRKHYNSHFYPESKKTD